MNLTHYIISVSAGRKWQFHDTFSHATGGDSFLDCAFRAGSSSVFLNSLLGKHLIDCIALASFTHSLTQVPLNCPRPFGLRTATLRKCRLCHVYALTELKGAWPRPIPIDPLKRNFPKYVPQATELGERGGKSQKLADNARTLLYSLSSLMPFRQPSQWAEGQKAWTVEHEFTAPLPSARQ